MKKRFRLILALLLIGCAAYLLMRVPHWKVENDIREAVFRYEFKHNASGLQQRANVYYLAIQPGWVDAIDAGDSWLDILLDKLGMARERSNRWEGSDPSSSFILRFRGHKPPVRKASRCRVDDIMVGVTDEHGANKGLVFIAGRIRWLSDTRVKVEGGYYEGGLSASGNVYLVERRHGRWVVIHDKMVWIS